MIVVADTSPFIALTNINQVELLPKLFGAVLVPPQVLNELGGALASPQLRAFSTTPPSWLRVQSPSQLIAGLSLHAGEIAAISLAVEVRADLLLIDERDGRLAAERNHLAVAGTIGVLERAASERLVNLREVFDALKQTDFWIPHAFLDARLQAFEARQREQRSRDRGH